MSWNAIYLLAEMNAVSKSDLDAAQASYDASVAGVQAAEANLRQARIKLSYTTIKAPITGMIGATEAREGEYVGRDPNPVILNTLSRIDTVRVQFSISENKYLEVARTYQGRRSDEEVTQEINEGRVEPQVELILADGSLFEHKGNIDFVNSQINANTGSLLIQASFPNPSRLLRPGLYAKGEDTSFYSRECRSYSTALSDGITRSVFCYGCKRRKYY